MGITIVLVIILMLMPMTSVKAFNLGTTSGTAIIGMDECFLYPGGTYSTQTNFNNQTGKNCTITAIELKEHSDGWAHISGNTLNDEIKEDFRKWVSLSIYDSSYSKSEGGYYSGSFNDLVGEIKLLNHPITLTTDSNGASKPVTIDVDLSPEADNGVEDITYKFDLIVYFEGDYNEPDPPETDDPEKDPPRKGTNNTPPEITLIGNRAYIIDQNAVYNDPGATAYDKEDGDITEDIVITINGEDMSTIDTSIIGQYDYVYNVEDSEGAKAEPVKRVVAVIPITSKPVITLIGEPYIEIEQGTEYIDGGAIAYDKIDGDITDKLIIKINDTYEPIDTSLVGINTYTYNVTNSQGVAADEVIRTVKVIPVRAIDQEVYLVDTGQRIPYINYFIGGGLIVVGVVLYIKKRRINNA
ncbi:immunoglobulin-like domain-containing protein [Vallitalea okinawensis]|uniref:immunoglobulin-like domain-containing protein n=1 Tax=Vallitalea okinawensis TaxID=2078660 RepID=UPI00147965A6|nr:immunoglobulin-like domain-containing protein [Vallitalea okinawensis]